MGFQSNDKRIQNIMIDWDNNKTLEIDATDVAYSVGTIGVYLRDDATAGNPKIRSVNFVED